MLMLVIKFFSSFLIADNGTSRKLEEKHLASTERDTPLYMAPEVMLPWMRQKGYDQRADLFSVGMIIYECLTGFLPYNPRPSTLNLNKIELTF